ncbi:MAG: universal stress protein [Gelidibacter sp.]
MKKIILPTDFSENAYNAIQYAVQLFKDVKTTFYLLHTYTPPVFQVEYLLQSPGQIGLGDSYKMKAMNQLEALKERLQEEFNNTNHTFVTRADFNTLTDDILILTKNEKADLVIMGTQGATGAKEILFGTNTTRVIRNTICPLIVVPSGFQYQAPKTIGFPTDYEIDYDKKQLKQLLELSKNNKANIGVIHVASKDGLTKEQSKNRNKLDELLAETSHTFNDLPEQEFIEAINTFQKVNPMNLLVMIRNKTTFFERLFVEPMVKKIGLQMNVPFMVIPHENK